jgi:hypothetical protein
MKRVVSALLVLTLWVPSAVQARAEYTEEQCESLLRRLETEKSVYVGPAEKECLRNTTLPKKSDRTRIAQGPTIPQTEPRESVAPTTTQRFLPASKPETYGQTPQLPLLPATAIREKAYDVAPFERYFEKVLPDLLHHENAEVVMLDGAGKILVRDDAIGHRKIEQAISAYRERFFTAYTVTLMKKHTRNWRKGEETELVAEGQVSGATSPQIIGGWSFSLKAEGGRVVLGLQRTSGMFAPISLLFDENGGRAEFTTSEEGHSVRYVVLLGRKTTTNN